MSWAVSPLGTALAELLCRPGRAFRECAVLFCHDFNLSYPGKAAATQLAGVEVTPVTVTFMLERT